MKKLATLGLALVLALPALSGCTGGGSGAADLAQANKSGEGNRQEIVFNAKSEPPDLNPLKSTDTTSFWIIDQLFEGLYWTNQNGEPVLAAAKDVQITENGKRYTFTLRDEAKWSNGDPVTAEDFVYSFLTHLDPAFGSTTAFQLYYIKGAEAFNKGTGKAEEVGVKALDDKTLQIDLVAPISYFPKLLATRYYAPINKKVAEANPNWAGDAKTYVSNGAYALTEWNHDSSVTIEKNEHYWNKADVSMPKVTWKMVNEATTYYQMYKSGELDVIQDLPTEVIEKEKNNPDFVNKPNFGTYMYMFNVEQPPFTNKKIRKAFAMALDRKLITESVSMGGETPAYAMVPDGVVTATGSDFRKEKPEYFAYDPQEAKRLLEEGMKEEGWTSFPETTLMYNTAENHKKIAQAVQEMISKNLGVELKLQNQEWKVYLDTTKQKNYQMARMGWLPAVVDPSFSLDYYLGDSPNNRTGWVNKEYDSLMAAAKVEQDPQKRNDLLHRAEDILMDEMPFIPVYFYMQNYLVKPDIHGLYFPPNGYPIARWATRGQ
ncbi:peptide ABC transporter substrate-binding protein [Brevibacillus sp. LEMMJ03]|uniref:peptide ABC transporter substrate-binding protein n=1 Tax=Brevibacillus sp. LEMMJ03 TaxID=2595056 RepID=UPI0011800A4E|nr:peptide ABC transporter substrate-binding protein [Brevibacillus sp. LEMMJ03]TRY26737.1 peptide ABC transporter substrate-binding protein [Brevibacillus sp. LEMMJ03]